MKKDNERDFEKLFHDLKVGLQKIYTDSSKYIEFLNSNSHFRKYSTNNKIYLYIQCMLSGFEGKYLNTFQGWKGLGFSVNKGEKAMEILMPSFGKYFKDENGKWISYNEANEDQKRKIDNGVLKVKENIKYFFIKKALFDVTQTNCPKEEYERLITEKVMPKSLEESQDKKIDFLFSHLKNYLQEKENVNVEFEDMEGSKKGYVTFDGKIALNGNNTNLQNLKTILHEFAHYILHINKNLDMEKYQVEVEAESVAYLVCRNFDIDTSEYSFKYINLYGTSKTEDQLYKSYENINLAATRINKAMEEVLKNEMISSILPGDIVYGNIVFSDNEKEARRLILIIGNEGDQYEAYNITSENKSYITSVKLSRDESNNLVRDSIVKMDVKYLVDRKDILSKIGHVSDKDMNMINEYKNIFESKNLIHECKSNPEIALSNNRGLDFSIKR